MSDVKRTDTRKSPRISCSKPEKSHEDVNKSETTVYAKDNGGDRKDSDVQNGMKRRVSTESKTIHSVTLSPDVNLNKTYNKNVRNESVKSSPKQTVRRKISFNSVESNEKYSDQESELEIIPRRKKLRSEVTEDELWEGFPQMVRFKRLTPQKYQNPQVPPKAIATHENKIDDRKVTTQPEPENTFEMEISQRKEEMEISHRKEEMEISQRKEEMEISQRKEGTSESNPTKSRTVANIFTDFSKVVQKNYLPNSPSGTVYTHYKDKSGTTANKKREKITPKRSARLQEKRESPAVKKDNDFVYTSIKKGDSKNEINLELLKKQFQQDLNLCNPALKIDSENNGVNSSNIGSETDNEIMKQIYKNTIVKERCSHSTPEKIDKEKQSEEDNNFESSSPQTDSAHSNTSNTCIKDSHEDSAENSVSTKETDTFNVAKDTQDSTCEKSNHLLSQDDDSSNCNGKIPLHCSFDRNEILVDRNERSADSATNLYISPTQGIENKNGQINCESEQKSIEVGPSITKEVSNDKTSAYVEGTRAETKDTFETDKRINKEALEKADMTSKNKSTLKLRIRKKDDGAEIVYSGASEDHAYVMHAPKEKNTRKYSKGKDLNAMSIRKRVLHNYDSKVKRRSPRVANASSVGKGPGMTEEMDSDCHKERIKNTGKTNGATNTRQEKTKKKVVSEEEQLLKNNRVGKFACMLWSSEQRRHFQQLHPDSTTEELDNLMRTAWEKLDNKVKLRYFFRANSATRDENKHSVKDIIVSESIEDEEKRTPSSSMVKFLSMSSEDQDIELKRWLKLFYEVSPNEYAKLKTLEKPKIRKDELKSKENKADHLKYYRKFLYQSIQDSKYKILEIYDRKKQRQQEIVKDAFGVVVKRLINDTDKVKFSRDVVSKKLAEVLLDLQNLENERKVGVSGAVLTSKSYESLLDDLKKENKRVDEVKRERSIDDIKCGSITNEIHDGDNENEFSQELLCKVNDKDLPLLEVDSITRILESSLETDDEYVFSKDIFEQLSSVFEEQAKKEIIITGDETENPEVRNPANILNNWVLADQFKALAKSFNRRSYNSMYSLLDKKKMLPFLNDADHCKNIERSLAGSKKQDVSNNNCSKPKPERYQAKIDRLSSQRPPQTAVPAIQMIEPLGLNKVSRPHIQQTNPTFEIATTQSIATNGQTFVKFTSQPGRCRVFSVRQAHK